jgi:L-malate glycosyltransferase
MKILLIANYIRSRGGIAVQVEILKEKLAKEGNAVSLFNTKWNIFYRFLILPFQLMYVGRKQDIFHIHGCSHAGFFPIVLGVLLGRILNKKIIITYHGGNAADFFAKYPRFISYIFKKANRIIVLSRFLAEEFSKYGIETEIIPNIINKNGSNYIQRKYFSPQIVTTRSLSSVYDIKTALNAFAIVQKKYVNATLHIVGAGPEESELKKMVVEKDIKNVVFTGRVDNNEIYKYLELADFWCNPTTKDNMPVSLLEAINAGLVIISTNVGGIPYMVEHNKSAWLVNKGDAYEMANGILYLIENPDKAQSLIINARATLQQYDWESIKGRLFQLYNN